MGGRWISSNRSVRSDRRTKRLVRSLPLLRTEAPVCSQNCRIRLSVSALISRHALWASHSLVGMASKARCCVRSPSVFSCPPQPARNAQSVRSVTGLLFAIAEYSQWPSSGLKRSSWKFFRVSWEACLR
jgi:hypothetical protein